MARQFPLAAGTSRPFPWQNPTWWAEGVHGDFRAEDGSGGKTRRQSLLEVVHTKLTRCSPQSGAAIGATAEEGAKLQPSLVEAAVEDEGKEHDAPMSVVNWVQACMRLAERMVRDRSTEDKDASLPELRVELWRLAALDTVAQLTGRGIYEDMTSESKAVTQQALEELTSFYQEMRRNLGASDPALASILSTLTGVLSKEWATAWWFDLGCRRRDCPKLQRALLLHHQQGILETLAQQGRTLDAWQHRRHWLTSRAACRMMKDLKLKAAAAVRESMSPGFEEADITFRLLAMSLPVSKTWSWKREGTRFVGAFSLAALYVSLAGAVLLAESPWLLPLCLSVLVFGVVLAGCMSLEIRRSQTLAETRFWLPKPSSRLVEFAPASLLASPAHTAHSTPEAAAPGSEASAGT